MKKIVLILWAFSLIACASPNIELPDPALLEMINAGRDEKSLLKADQIRVIHPPDFPEVTLIAYVVGTNDLLLGSALMNSKIMTPNEACGLALKAKGWEQAEGQQKIALAMQWLEQAQLGFGETIVKTKPPHFGTNWVKWSDPETLANLSGSVRIIAWIESRPTGASSRRFHKNVFWFSKEGFLLRSKVVETFELDP